MWNIACSSIHLLSCSDDSYQPPFDRHDWLISRPLASSSPSEQEPKEERIRYVIDFYTGRGGAGSFYLDVRPALDGWEGIKMRWERWWNLKTNMDGKRENMWDNMMAPFGKLVLNQLTLVPILGLTLLMLIKSWYRSSETGTRVSNGWLRSKVLVIMRLEGESWNLSTESYWSAVV
jgi:hypothetical protein